MRSGIFAHTVSWLTGSFTCASLFLVAVVRLFSSSLQDIFFDLSTYEILLINSIYPSTMSSKADVSAALFAYIDERKKLYIDRLGEAVAIPSISAELPDSLPSIVQMMDWTAAHMTRLGGKVQLIPNPVATAERALPPILMGEFTVDPHKKTLCVYGTTNFMYSRSAHSTCYAINFSTLVRVPPRTFGRATGRQGGWLGHGPLCFDGKGRQIVRTRKYR